MLEEYPHCCLESPQMPVLENTDTSFDFSANKRTCEFYLSQALEAIKAAQRHQDWDRYSLKAYYGSDICLEDGLSALQAAIAKD
ncbi:MAG: hypothetical protein ACR2LR_06030 [Hassallia sp.]